MSYSNSFNAYTRRTGTASMQRVRDHRRTAYASRSPRRNPCPRSLPQFAVAVALLCALGASCCYAITTLGSLVQGASTGAASSSGPRSTPASEWRAGEVPALYQRDPAWSAAAYAEDDFGTTGCGPTCLSMVYIALTGKSDMAPADMGALSERMGCASPEGTAWLFMTDGAAELGLTAREIAADESSVRGALLSGSPVIRSVGPGDFTTTGHFIVLTGIDGQGRLTIRDPNSSERTGKAWDFDTVLGQCRALWAYSAA